MQLRAFGWLFAGVPPPALGLHGGTRAEHFDVATIASIQEHGSVDPSGDRETEMLRTAQAFGVESHRRVEIHRSDCHMVETWSGSLVAHGSTVPCRLICQVAGQTRDHNTTIAAVITSRRSSSDAIWLPSEFRGWQPRGAWP